MTEIAFHFNVPDKLHYSCRLLRKAYQSGAGVVVTGAQDVLDDLDRYLWTYAATEFLPHCPQGASAANLAASPIVLSVHPEPSPRHPVLINLGAPLPDGFEQFARLLEIVSHEPDDRLAARGRWKHYADRGYAMLRHDLAASADKS